MRYCGMKVPTRIQIFNGVEFVHEFLPEKKITECDRKTPVRGYRVDKPEFKDSFFFPTYSRAVDILLMGFRGKGKIEAVR